MKLLTMLGLILLGGLATLGVIYVLNQRRALVITGGVPKVNQVNKIPDWGAVIQPTTPISMPQPTSEVTQPESENGTTTTTSDSGGGAQTTQTEFAVVR